jgi:hypothetical protein
MAFEGGRIAEPVRNGTREQRALPGRGLRLRSLAPALPGRAEAGAFPAAAREEAASWRIDVFRLGVALAGLAGFLLVPAAIVAAVVFLLFR